MFWPQARGRGLLELSYNERGTLEAHGQSRLQLSALPVHSGSGEVTLTLWQLKTAGREGWAGCETQLRSACGVASLTARG